MERHIVAPRADWQKKVEAQGLLWHGAGGDGYWNEGSYYSFTLSEIEKIEAATEEVYRLFLEAGDALARNRQLMARMGIPDHCRDAIRDAWDNEPPALNYGRFDFGYNADGEPKLFEFNCDTPTSMLEAAIIQWDWKEEVFPGLDQFNSLHEKLIARWQAITPQIPNARVWFTHIADDAHEDTITTTYMRELAELAGLETHAVIIDDIGIDKDGRIVDQEDRLISTIFKLYPWEWIVNERFGPDVIKHLPDTFWIEPIWKMLWSNKAVLQQLWSMNPGHPNLLPASFDRGPVGPSYVTKPFLAREGANIEIVERGNIVARTDGGYDEDSVLYQQLYPLRDFGSGYPVIGSWVVDGEPAGMGIREDGLITGNTARFIPHVIKG